LNLEILTSVKKQPSDIINAMREALDSYKTSTIVVASHHGNSAIKLAESFKGVKVVSVSEFSYSDKAKKRMKKLKMILIEKVDLPIQDDLALRKKVLQYGPGVKAALEVAVIASQNQLVEGKFIAIGGKRLNTVLLMDPKSKEDLKIEEVISLPPS
jgi:hypothetical protein